MFKRIKKYQKLDIACRNKDQYKPTLVVFFYQTVSVSSGYQRIFLARGGYFARVTILTIETRPTPETAKEKPLAPRVAVLKSSRK